MNSETPSLEPAIEAIKSYASADAPNHSPQTKETLREVVRRLERLSVLADELMVINNKLWASKGLNFSFDPSTGELVMSVGDAKQSIFLNRANPDVPISINSFTGLSAYNAGAADEVTPEDSNLRLELEAKLEGFYQSAHRVLRLLGTIPFLPKIKCMAITRVRNNLIEHPDDGALYSFGVGTSGPRVKPKVFEPLLSLTGRLAHATASASGGLT